MSELQSIENWFKERPLWQQEAMRMLCMGEEIGDKELLYLYTVCFNEANGVRNKIKGVPEGLILKADKSNIIRLNEIKEPKGINNLNPQNPLQFGKSNLCIIYGQNASGKTGYVRLLKLISSKKGYSDVLDNVYHDEDVGKSCYIKYSINDIENDELLQFNNNYIANELSLIDIFDKEAAESYIKDEKIASYEPRILANLSQLTDLCKNISAISESHISKNQVYKISLPEHIRDSQAARLYQSLSDKNDIEQIKKDFSWNNKDEEELINCIQIINEKTPDEKIKQLNRQKEVINELELYFINIISSISEEEQNSIISLKKTYNQICRKVEDGLLILNESTILQIDSDTWRALWEAAKKYSNQIAYPLYQFPYMGINSRCPLCQQELSDDAKNRFKSFNTYITNSLNQEKENALNNLNNKLKLLVVLKSNNEIRANCEFLSLSIEQINEILSINQTISDTINKIITNNGFDYYIKEPSMENISLIVSEKREQIIKMINNYSSLIDPAKKQQLTDKYRDLQGKKWLCDNIKLVISEYEKIQIINRHEKAKRLANTRAITDKSKLLSEELITLEYIKRFNEEIKALGVNVEVSIGSDKASYGKVFRKLILNCKKGNINAIDVLSEGEAKIVSIAAFLADTTVKSINAPFIFDDPITSLDLKYEKAVVNRLVELSKTRQVIVFTHRLSMINHFYDIAKYRDIELDQIELYKTSLGAGEPRETTIRGTTKVNKRLRILSDKWLTHAQKLASERDTESYYIKMKSICTEFRICIEDTIESCLLQDLIRRHERNIRSSKSLKFLLQISESECKIIDELMCKYSYTEHSQPSEDYSIQFEIDDPNYSPEEINKDVLSLLELVDILNKRKN